MKHVSLILLTATLSGCNSGPELPAVYGQPGDPTLVRLPIPCDVALPPVAEFRWTGPAEALAQHPELACEMARQLKNHMDSLGYIAFEIELGDWNRARYVTFSADHTPPPPNHEQPPTALRRFELCADVRERPRRFCVVMGEGQDLRPQFYHSHR